MNESYEFLCVAAVTGWVISRPLGIFLTAQMANAIGLLAALLLGLVYSIWPASGWAIAIFSPVSVGIALLALGDLARAYGVMSPRWSMRDLSAVLVVYLGFLGMSLGATPFDPYGFGYSASGSATVAVALAALAYVRKDWLLGIIVVISQSVWLAGVGSENLFDHLASAILIPAIGIGFTRRFRGA